MKESLFIGQISGNAMREKVDLLDRKILYILSNNSRFSHVSIANKLKIKREVVSYRIKKLIERKIINGFFTYLNVRRLGFTVIAAHIKLKQIYDEKKIVEYLMKSEHITHVQCCSGRYDILLEISVKEIDQFDIFFNDFLFYFMNYIENYDIFFCLEGTYLGRGILLETADERKQLDALLELKGSSFSKNFNKKNQNNSFMNLDELDKKILQSIKFDSSKNVVDIAKEVHCSPKTVMSKMSSLVKENVIKKFLPLINFSTFGFHWYVLFLQMIRVDEKKFITFLEMHPNILHYRKYIGKWNYKLNIFVEDNIQFQKMVRELKELFPENIAGFDSIIVHNQVKFDQIIE